MENENTITTNKGTPYEILKPQQPDSSWKVGHTTVTIVFSFTFQLKIHAKKHLNLKKSKKNEFSIFHSFDNGCFLWLVTID